MQDCRKFYIDGHWVDPAHQRELPVIDPASEKPVGVVSLGSAADVDRAMAAARKAFADWSQSTPADRAALLGAILAEYKRRYEDIAQAITLEMGAPAKFARDAQAGSGVGHLATTLKALRAFEFEGKRGTTQIRHEPVGVCALITPWNWPINQVACKVAPALAAGCTMVLKPSEIAPLSAQIFAEVLDAAGVPAGVFNLVHGDGAGVGAALAAHAETDMVSFTGSTRAGIAVSKAAADTVKRVSLELGGKSPNLILDDADIGVAVRHGVRLCFENTGQSCNAPTRMLVPASRYDEAVAAAQDIASAVVVGSPQDPATQMGPLVSRVQYDKVQRLIQTGIDEGARVVAGGTGRPERIEKGYFVRPTVFADVNNTMTIAREEIFGPVLSMLSYGDEEEAIGIANDTPYGLSAYVYSGDKARARRVANHLRAGMVHLNGASTDINAPFGGYKQSGNGREWGREGLEEFMEIKAVMGYDD